MIEKLKLKNGKGDFELRKAFFNMYSRGLLNQSCATKMFCFQMKILFTIV